MEKGVVVFVQAERKVPYLVGLDNEDAAWEAWDVASWPTHGEITLNAS